MAIIGKVEKRNWKTKLLDLSIHAVLLLGSVTMVYPLLIMVSGSFKSSVDFFDFSLSPEYLYDDALLYRKFILSKYNSNNIYMFNAFRLPLGALNRLQPPSRPSRARYSDYKYFLDHLRQDKPHYWRGIGMTYEPGVVPLSQREYRDWLQRKFGRGEEGLAAVNQAYGTSHRVWENLLLPSENFTLRQREIHYTTSVLKDILEFKNDHVDNVLSCWTDIDATLVYQLRTAYANRLEKLNQALGTDYNTWAEITLPLGLPADATPRQARMWRDFVDAEVNCGFLTLLPEAEPSWQEYVRRKYHGDLDAVNRIYRLRCGSFRQLRLPAVQPESGQIRSDWNNFVQEEGVLDSRHIRLQSLVGEYRDWLKEHYQTLEILNEEFDLGYHSFDEVELPAAMGRENLQKDRDWLAFLQTIHPEETGLSPNAVGSYRNFVLAKFRRKDGGTDFHRLSLAFRTEIGNVAEIPFHRRYPVSPVIPNLVKQIYLEFIGIPGNAVHRTLNDPRKLQDIWVRFLKRRYGYSIAKLNQAWSMVYTDWDRISPPTAEYEWFNVLDNRWLLIKEYLKRNYLMVLDTIQTNGFAARNTLIYCALAVLASLLVNPLCAYGLSRFKMAPAYKILLFLMLPMAFPAMVLGIPQFLLIKNLGLLNTFAALILPTMANGYMIFLLKGFFDSLPKELFESAAIDGASEWTVFWHIAMGLSTPILSVLALNTFTAAYGNFMMAFLLCQDKSMWTMMVYLYQLQQHASQAVGFAALIIAAIPTLLVFIFCQNIIIKGIVVPTEK